MRPEIGRTDGYFSLSAGTYRTINADGAFTIPVSSVLAARVSLLEQHRDPWVTVQSAQPGNLYNGQKVEGYDDRAGRFQLLYKPGTDFDALLNLHGRALNGSARVFRANIIKRGSNDLVDNFDKSTISTNGDNEQQFRSTGGSLALNWTLGDYTFSSITGIESINKYYTRGDIDGGDTITAADKPFQVETAGGVNDHDQISEELRIASKFAGPVNYQAGVYVFHEKLAGQSYGYNSATAAQTSYSETKQTSKSYAVFGSVNYDLLPELRLRGGLRYTHDSKDFDLLTGFSNPGRTSLSGSKVTGDLSATYKLSDATNVYARLATGYRGASFGSPTSGQALTSAAPETTTSYEAGVKTDLLGKRAQLNASVFRYDVKNQQLTAVGGGSNTTTLTNAAKTIGQGFELDFRALPTDRLRLSAGLSYNDTKIEDPNLRVAVCGSGCTVTNPNAGGLASIDGNPLPQAPKWIANATARYGMPLGDTGELYVYVDVSYRSKINLFLYESLEYTGKPLTELGLKLGYAWANGKYDASLFCRNCTDRIVVVGAIDFHNLTGFINEPRILGAQFRANFD